MKRILLIILSLGLLSFPLLAFHGFSMGVQWSSPALIRLAGSVGAPVDPKLPYIERIILQKKFAPLNDRDRSVIIALLERGLFL